VHLREELLRLALEKRDMARRATRLARSLSLIADSERLLRLADEYEAQAVHLELRASQGNAPMSAPPSPDVPSPQQQAQQQRREQEKQETGQKSPPKS
jgi:hypothetical protein